MAVGCCPATKESGEQLVCMLAAVDSSPFSTEFKSYMKLSLQCGRLTADPPPPAPSDDVPLLKYRRALCGNPVRVDAMTTVRTTVPRFVEASFFLGRVAMGTLFRTDGTQARTLFEQAYARFPDSPTIASSSGPSTKPRANAGRPKRSSHAYSS